MNTKQLRNFFEQEGFNVYEDDDLKGTADLETWTKGGVNMFIYLDPFTIESFEEEVNSFDVDEEINLHRESVKYKRDFTIRESLEDFESYHMQLKQVLINLKEAAKRLEK